MKPNSRTKNFLFKWTPRIIIAGFAGYYVLGIAYDLGIMAKMDKIAISILKDSFGYAGVGAIMPTFQWYSAWTLRMIAAGVAGGIYSLIEKFIRYLLDRRKIRFISKSVTPS